MKGDDIADRLLSVAARVVKLVDALPTSYTGKHISNQLLRAGTAGGANYEEARGAESKRDFLHKTSIALKELQETRYWLRLVQHADLLPTQRVEDLVRETQELCAVLGQSVLTARKNMQAES